MDKTKLLARSAGDLIMRMQLSSIRTIAVNHGIDPLIEARRVFNLSEEDLPDISYLSRLAGCYFIDHLKQKPYYNPTELEKEMQGK